MKSYYKSEIAQLAGVSKRTLQRWMAAHRDELLQRGFNVHGKLVCPQALHYIAQEYGIDVEWHLQLRFWLLRTKPSQIHAFVIYVIQYEKTQIVWQIAKENVSLRRETSKHIVMDDKTKKYDEMEFEGTDFVNECLASFDENVSKIEAEHEITSKSA